MNLQNNIVTLLDKAINKNENKNEEFITQDVLKQKVMSNKFILVIGMIIAVAYLISYIYGVYLSFFCSKNIINLLSSLVAALVLPHLHLLYRLARPCKERVWLSKGISVINTLLLIIILPLIFMIVPAKVKFVLAGIISFNTAPGLGLMTFNFIHVLFGSAMIMGVIGMIFSLF